MKQLWENRLSALLEEAEVLGGRLAEASRAFAASAVLTDTDEKEEAADAVDEAADCLTDAENCLREALKILKKR